MKAISVCGATALLIWWGSLVLAGPVNINTADAATLAAELAGVGPALAQAIVYDREQNGRFESAEALVRVKGIGQRIIDQNRDNIRLEDAAPSP
jgi:competence protein ComEA